MLRPSETVRLETFDYLRTLCALGVVIYHWPTFYFPLVYDQIGLGNLPAAWLLGGLYNTGSTFVEVFFAISGYVFYWLYAQAIANRKLGVWQFTTARIARLYPLFLFSLIVVALLQAIFHSLYSYYLVYDSGDLLGFLRSALMIHMWTPRAPQIFNGPSWSLSVEIFLYALFFGLAYVRRTGWLTALILVIIGIGFRKLYPPITRELPSFFLGALAFMAVQALEARRASGKPELWLNRILTGLCLTGWIVAAIKANPLINEVFERGGAQLPAPAGSVLAAVSGLFSLQSFWYVLTPVTLIVLALNNERMSRWVSPRLKWTGDISYSIYLWHFPVLLLLTTILNKIEPKIRTTIVSSPLFMLAVLATIVFISAKSFRHFEVPAGRFIKARFADGVLKIFRSRPAAGE